MSRVSLWRFTAGPGWGFEAGFEDGGVGDAMDGEMARADRDR